MTDNRCKQLIVFQSFYGALLTFSYFLLQGKVLCFAHEGTSLARCLFLKRSEDLVNKMISLVLLDTNRSFKYSFFDERIVYRSFLNINLSVSISYTVDKLHAHAALCEEYVQHTRPPIPNTENREIRERQTANNRTFAFCL